MLYLPSVSARAPGSRYRLGETKKQEALPRPVRADQKERPLGRQRRHDHRLERAEAENAESREERSVRRHADEGEPAPRTDGVRAATNSARRAQRDMGARLALPPACREEKVDEISLLSHPAG